MYRGKKLYEKKKRPVYYIHNAYNVLDWTIGRIAGLMDGLWMDGMGGQDGRQKKEGLSG